MVISISHRQKTVSTLEEALTWLQSAAMSVSCRERKECGEKRGEKKKSAKALLSINTTVKGSDVNSTKAVARGHIIKSAGHRTHFFLLQ